MIIAKPKTKRPVAKLGFHQIGKRLPRIDASGKVTGKTKYAGDFSMPRMLHAKVLRSPQASARLKRIDVSKARALPGVACVLTAEDLPDRLMPNDIPGQTGKDRLKTDNQILVKERVRYQGEKLALVAAETLSIAEQAIELIEYELEPLPGVFDPFDALKAGAPIVQGEDNVVATHQVRKGDIESGFEAADVIVENTFRTQHIEHAFLDPEAGLAWSDENGVVNIRMSTQVIEHFRFIADALGVPHNKVRVRGAMVGGGFGGKEDITIEVYLALLTQKTGRPVQMIYTREDSMFGHGKRHPFDIKLRTGFTNQGKITAVQADITADAGAYVYLSPYVLLYSVTAIQGPYRVDNVFVNARAVATNNMYTSAFRGFGAAQACIAYEQQMDEAAGCLGIGPADLRRRNFLRTGDSIATGYPVDSAVWTEQCMDAALHGLGERSSDAGPFKIGRGVACYQQSYGRITWLHDTSEAWVGIEVDGTVVVQSGVTDIGAGQISALAQIAAELLGVHLDDVRVHHSDSAATPLAGTTTATRALYMTGNAVKKAAEAVRGRLIARAAVALAVDEKFIDLSDRRAYDVNHPEYGIQLSELVALCASEGIHRSELSIFKAPFTDPVDRETGQGRVHPDYVYGAHAIEVSVDIETGEVTILKSVAAHDVGQAINPQAVEGQIEGGTAQGHGYALTENLIYQDGILVTPSFSEYLMPTAMDVPMRVDSIILESPSGKGPFGAKGIGEPSLTPVAPAIANAVADAIGTRIFDFPITPEKVVRALHHIA